MLRAHYGLDVATTLQLRGGVGGNASMEEMAARLLGIRGVKKSRKVGTTKWDRETLSKKQVRYVCLDAFLSRRLGVHARRSEQ
ncbi:hypothetical protein PR202_ga28638 [Eleusine coracana subsp. coracana]|uniref:3'-5' exonuclease domain-containing protein n=1 Tax=Eleusine coracana subsp. coracana TaxID=191504 RepID=A0AAV5DIS4_ELECO|nr:hypothetical protein PR202_ga28638 [Eleusine coracana subsp. coracana]